MSDQSDDSPPSGPNKRYSRNGGARRPKDRLPPESTRLEKVILFLADAIFIVALAFLAWLCVTYFTDPELLPSCICWAYLGLVALLVGLFVDRYLRHERNVYEARLFDRSEVESFIDDSRNVKNYSDLPEEEFETRKEEFETQINQLEKVGPAGWTELKVLLLNQMLVDHLKGVDLVAEARLSLAEIEDYAEDSAYRYDERRAEEWRSLINKAIKDVEEATSDVQKKESGEKLRSNQKALLEHLAYYRKNWAEGSKMVGALMVCSVAAALVLLAAGVLPILYPGEQNLHIYNWAFLGASGALAAGLLALHKSDLPEVGNTEGRQEIRRGVIGTTLGAFAGVLVYAAIKGGLLSGSAFTSQENSISNTLAVFWGIVSGVLFEQVFERIRSKIEFSK